MNVIPDLPSRIWIDPRDLTVHHEDGELRKLYVLGGRQPKEKKRHKHYKTDEEVAEIRQLADSGLTQKEVAAKLGVHPRTVRKFVGRVYSKRSA